MHRPPGNFENVYSQRCIFLDFGDKIKGIQDRLLSGNDEKNYDELECWLLLLFNIYIVVNWNPEWQILSRLNICFNISLK